MIHTDVCVQSPRERGGERERGRERERALVGIFHNRESRCQATIVKGSSVDLALVNRGPGKTQDVETISTAVFEKDLPIRIGTMS